MECVCSCHLERERDTMISTQSLLRGIRVHVMKKRTLLGLANLPIPWGQWQDLQIGREWAGNESQCQLWVGVVINPNGVMHSHQLSHLSLSPSLHRCEKQKPKALPPKSTAWLCANFSDSPLSDSFLRPNLKHEWQGHLAVPEEKDGKKLFFWLRSYGNPEHMRGRWGDLVGYTWLAYQSTEWVWCVCVRPKAIDEREGGISPQSNATFAHIRGATPLESIGSPGGQRRSISRHPFNQAGNADRVGPAQKRAQTQSKIA